MGADAPISFTFAGLPANYCFTDFNRLALDIVAAMSGYVPGQYSVIIDSETEPVAADRGKLWHKLLPGGSPTGKLFKYFLGKWVTPNRVEPSGNERIWWTGSESDLWAYDGGDGTDPGSNPPTATTGAMWQRDTDFDARFPLQAGTSPSISYTDADGNAHSVGNNTFSVGDEGGEEFHAQTEEELKAHKHGLSASEPVLDINATSSRILYGEHDIVTDLFTATALTKNVGDNKPSPVMPPFKVGMWAMRSARIYEVA